MGFFAQTMRDAKTASGAFSAGYKTGRVAQKAADKLPKFGGNNSKPKASGNAGGSAFSKKRK